MTSDDSLPALEAAALGRRYRSGWAVRDCTFALPRGRVATLVGPNGAGKSTLLSMAVGLTSPSEGSIAVLGQEPRGTMPPSAAFVSQQRRVPTGLTVAEILRMARSLNDRWDPDPALRVLDTLHIPQSAVGGTLSEGERTQLCLALALGRTPDVLLLDEPLGPLDPLARDGFLRALMSEVAERDMTVLLSTHLLAEVEEVCDHLILLDGGRVQLAGDIDELLGSHRLLVGPTSGAHQLDAEPIVHQTRTERQATVLVRGDGGQPSGWDSEAPTLESLVLAYLRASRQEQRP